MRRMRFHMVGRSISRAMLVRPSLLTALSVTALVACGGRRPPGPTPEPEEPDPVGDVLRETIDPLYQKGVLHGGMVIAVVDPARAGGASYLRFGHLAGDQGEAPDQSSIFEIG